MQPERPGSLTYERIYQVVRQIPKGNVATYGQIASIVGRCGPRQVGYAMSCAPSGLPWQRVINRQGRVSVRSGGRESAEQRDLLEGEGVVFDCSGRVDLELFGWPGPDIAWMERHGYGPVPLIGDS